MKKALSLVLAVCMIFSMAVMASAAGTVTFKIVNDSGSTITDATGTYRYTDSGVVDSGAVRQGTFSISVNKGGELNVSISGYNLYQDVHHELAFNPYKVSPTMAGTIEIYAVKVNNTNDPTFNPGGSTGGSSGGSGGGGGGGSSSSGSKTSTSADRTFSNIPLGSKLGGSTNIGGSTTTTTGSVTTASATKATTSAVASAVSQAVATGSNKASAKVTFANAGALTTDVMNAIAKAAKSASKGLDVSVVVNADTVDKSGAVLARMSVDVALALRNGSAIQTTIDVNPNSTVNANIANHFAKYFSNKVATVAFAQKGSFGMNVPVAVKVNLSALDVSSLVFYSYDVAANSFVEIQTEYFVDTNGYLHFTTPVGNNIVITDAPLTAK